MARKTKKSGRGVQVTPFDVPPVHPQDPDWITEVDERGATLLDMYACAAPPPPAGFNPVVKEKRPQLPQLPRLGVDAARAWTYWVEEGEFSPEDMSAMSRQEAETLRRLARAVREAEHAIAAFDIAVEIQRVVQWRWIFARRMLAARKAAHEEPIHHVR